MFYRQTRHCAIDRFNASGTQRYSGQRHVGDGGWHDITSLQYGWHRRRVKKRWRHQLQHLHRHIWPVGNWDSPRLFHRFGAWVVVRMGVDDCVAGGAGKNRVN